MNTEYCSRGGGEDGEGFVFVTFPGLCGVWGLSDVWNEGEQRFQAAGLPLGFMQAGDAKWGCG